MKRIIYTILFVIAAIGFTGCDASQIGGPDGPNPVPVTPAEQNISQTNVVSISDGYTVGISSLGRNEHSVGVVVRTQGIPNDQALTLWWVVFNNPDACASRPCSELDLFTPEVEADVLYADGNIVRDGAVAFRATLIEGIREGSIADILDLPAASGLHDAEKAEVHVIVRSHGPVNQQVLERQLHSFDGGCNIELHPGMTPDSMGECADLQFAAHMPDLE